MELGSPWVCGHIHPNTFPKALLPIFFGSAKKTIYSLKIHKPKKRKKEKKKTREQTQKEKKRVGKVQKRSKRKATVESCIGSFRLITLGFLEIEGS
jgi:hypothetical protein